MKVSNTIQTLCWAAAFIALAGCGDSRSYNVYEPGVYKGAADPLLAKLGKPESRQQLQERFSLGQVDR